MNRGRPRNFDEKQALEAAMTVFWQQGYEATSCDDLLAAMDINAGSMYSTFGDKETLYNKSFELYLETVIQSMVGILNGPGTPLENVRELVHCWEKAVSSKDFRGCLVTLTLLEFGDQKQGVALKAKKVIDDLRCVFQEKLTEAADSGELTSDIPPSDLAAFLVNTAQGLSVMGKANVKKDILQGVINSTLAMLR